MQVLGFVFLNSVFQFISTDCWFLLFSLPGTPAPTVLKFRRWSSVRLIKFMHVFVFPSLGETALTLVEKFGVTKIEETVSKIETAIFW